jgi:N-succinyldiaminopimelate aminotransferase
MDGEVASTTVFEEVAKVIRRVGRKDVINLHLGDTHSLPPPPALPAALDLEEAKGFAQYCDTKGIPVLKHLLLKKAHERNNLPWVAKENIQITCGAIHAMYSTFAALLDPGEEVMVLAPHWHMANGVIGQAGGRARDVDFYISLAENPGCDIGSLLEKALTPKTAALYLNTPCNPTGQVLDRAALEEVARFATVHDLWVVSDEAYEDFIFAAKEHVSIAALPGMQDRTVTIFTFSKCLAAAGYRVGYAVGNREVMKRIHRASASTIYNAPTNNQHLVAQALACWDAWFPDLYNRYRKKRDLVCDRFKGCFVHPEGGFYVFFDSRPALKGRSPEALLEAMVREGVAVVPGRAFGEGLDSWFRFCFVAVEDDVLEEGIERLNRVVSTD